MCTTTTSRRRQSKHVIQRVKKGRKGEGGCGVVHRHGQNSPGARTQSYNTPSPPRGSRQASRTPAPPRAPTSRPLSLLISGRTETASSLWRTRQGKLLRKKRQHDTLCRHTSSGAVCVVPGRWFALERLRHVVKCKGSASRSRAPSLSPLPLTVCRSMWQPSISSISLCGVL